MIKIMTMVILFMVSIGTSYAEDVKEQIALVINLRGKLCAKVVEIQRTSTQDVYIVTCTEYRGSDGKIVYRFEASNSKVVKLRTY